MARQAEELRAGRALGPGPGERLAAAGHDERHVGQRLDVVDDGRLAEQPDLDRERRLVARLAALALDRLEERRLLAADVGAGAAPELDIEGEARAQDVVAEEARLAGANDRVGHARLGLGVFAADVEVALARAGREGRDRHRLDGRERVALEEDPVLERAGLGFVGVADEVVGLGGLARDRRPLAAGREGGATAAQEAGLGDLGDDPLGAHLEGAGQGRVAAVGAVVIERGRVDDADAAEEPRRLGRRLGAMRRRIRPSGRLRIREGVRPRTSGVLERSHDADRVDRWQSERRGRLAGDRDHGRRRAWSHSPRHGLRSHVARPSRIGSPAAPTARVRSPQSASAPANRQAMSSQTWATTGGRGVVAKSA